MPRSVQVSAAARLHFGLLAFGNTASRQYGGAGLMIDQPRVKLHFSPSAELQVTGPGAERVTVFVNRWAQHHGIQPTCDIQVKSVIPAHSGFGSGTQLGLATAAGLDKFWRMENAPSAEHLAASVGRGERSAVGTYGFLGGGFVAESGKYLDEPLGKLMRQCTLPEEWRIVLLQQPNAEGLSGTDEMRAFDGELPAIPNQTSLEMLELLEQRMIPAVAASDCRSFGEAVYDYGILAGNCFAKLQGGPFSSPEAEKLVITMRNAGVAGVGQSSWGPTLFGIVESESVAHEVVAELDDIQTKRRWLSRIVAIENRGASVHSLDAAGART